MLVLVVAKKVREELSVGPGVALRAGLAMAGAEARLLFAGFAARLKPCPDTKLLFNHTIGSIEGHGLPYVNGEIWGTGSPERYRKKKAAAPSKAAALFFQFEAASMSGMNP